MHDQVLVLAETTAFGDKNPDFSGRWANQMNSVMDLTVSGHDVTGKYNSASSGSEGGSPIIGEIKGYVAGDRISFIVLWPGGSMTAWVGQVIDSSGDQILRTLWQLVTEIPDVKEPKFLWQSTFAGADEFTR